VDEKMTSDFLEFSKNILIEKLGKTGEDLFTRVLAKKPLNEESSNKEFTEFIKTMENIVPLISDEKKAEEICLALRNKLNDTSRTNVYGSNEEPDNVSIEIEDFLKEHDLPTDGDVQDYVRYLKLKYNVNSRKIHEEIMDKIKLNLNDSVNMDKIQKEIDIFLERFLEPEKTDIDDFVCYLQVLKLRFREEELREHIEKERLYRKFHEPEDDTVGSGIDQLANIVKNNDKEEIQKSMKNEKISYLLKDAADIPDISHEDLTELIKPNEKEMK
jgi:hypothetical protein